jgi:lipoprotein NlpD
MSDKLILIIFFITFICSCTSTSIAPVDSRRTGDVYNPAPVTSYDAEPVTKGFHEVSQGDTLYSISWRYGLDYRDVANWNKISGSYIIYPGQRIRLIPNAINSSVSKINPIPKKVIPVPNQSTSISLPSRVKPVLAQQKIQWKWPTNGKIIKSNSPIAQKGLDISGTYGQEVQTAAEGVVVYSGSGLLGYGKLIIIKHNDTFLSAYAHNQIMHVKEGDKVMTNQKIGTMGKGTKDQPLLHFEIRKEGKPVDPLQYLPVRS